MNRFFLAITVFILVAAMPLGTQAQDAEPALAEAATPIVIGESLTIHSEILGEDRAGQKNEENRDLLHRRTV